MVEQFLEYEVIIHWWYFYSLKFIILLLWKIETFIKWIAIVKRIWQFKSKISYWSVNKERIRGGVKNSNQIRIRNSNKERKGN